MAGHNQKHKGTLKELLKTSIPAVIDLDRAAYGMDL